MKCIESADGIFLGGGDQMKLVSIIGGTTVADAIRAAHQRGIVVGGTSAGAAALAKTTLAGNETDEHGQLVEQYIGPGLGLMRHPTIIDTHFSQRRRLYRLFVALAEYPDLMGIGIDEDTAIVLRGDVGEVVGRGRRDFRGRSRSALFQRRRAARRHSSDDQRDARRRVGAGHEFDFTHADLVTR